uniref:Uncharacterized protein n=1 Tax=Candidatus Kentrum sp. UNK TaxID=2126344 RepID=A0A451AAS3_9GAMM|nr:MAG: hypothetical protein BECKUNK1418G_GA0071005_10309 [Candidatus Kentron sp. UNK]VFK73018.1 MAG: hypothetical protein BECKUNK1418H_GA0071006_11574 [Candidatus Kentron sp. UNK]
MVPFNGMTPLFTMKQQLRFGAVEGWIATRIHHLLLPVDALRLSTLRELFHPCCFRGSRGIGARRRGSFGANIDRAPYSTWEVALDNECLHNLLARLRLRPMKHDSVLEEMVDALRLSTLRPLIFLIVLFKVSRIND